MITGSILSDNTNKANSLLKELLNCSKSQLARRIDIETEINSLYLPTNVRRSITTKITKSITPYLPKVIVE